MTVSVGNIVAYQDIAGTVHQVDTEYAWVVTPDRFYLGLPLSSSELRVVSRLAQPTQEEKEEMRRLGLHVEPACLPQVFPKAGFIKVTEEYKTIQPGTYKILAEGTEEELKDAIHGMHSKEWKLLVLNLPEGSYVIRVPKPPKVETPKTVKKVMRRKRHSK